MCLSESKPMWTYSSSHAVSTESTYPSFEPVDIRIKIEKYDSQGEDIFEPDIKLEVGRTLVSPKIEPKPEPTVLEADVSTNQTQPEPPPKPAREGASELTCEVCGRIFRRGSSLALHMRSHDEQRGTFQCHLCHRSFPYKINLIRHLSSPCAERLTVPCPVCQKEFQTEVRMRSHVNVHHTERPHRCDLCGKRFNNSSALGRHRARHAAAGAGAPKRFACSVCDKSFAMIYALECHLRTHTKERPFQCAVCVRAFSHKHNMLRHMQRHNKVLHLKCEVCDKVFPRESRLKYHMRVHWPDKKPYKCGECHKTYSHQQNITRHYRKKHPHVEYIASTTDAEFANKAWEMRVAQGAMGSKEAANSNYILPECREPGKDLSALADTDEECIAEPELVMLDNDIK